MKREVFVFSVILLFTAIMFVCPAGSTAFESLFYCSLSQNTLGYEHSAITMRDYNSDGIPDIAAVGWEWIQSVGYCGKLLVLLGDGEGKFTVSESRSYDDKPSDIISADFNGDGHTDLATGNESGNISVMTGNGDGTFSAETDYPAQYGNIITCADFNNDGHIDLATTGDTGISVILNNGDGTFASEVTCSTGGSCSNSIATGDFDNNGFVDIATTNGGSDDYSILLNAGDGSFEAASNYATSSSPSCIATGNFNEDGDIDLAIGRDSGMLSILTGDGDGTFTSTETSDIGGYPVSITTGDFNNDGHIDLATVKGDDKGVSVLLGSGDGGFSNADNYPSPAYNHRSISTTDFDQDGKTDLIIHYDGNAMLMPGKGDGTFISNSQYSTNAWEGMLSTVTGDFDEDGHLDIAGVGGSLVYLLFGEGNGSFADPVRFGDCCYNSITAADFDKDGHLDLVCGCDDIGECISFFPGTGSGTFGAPVYSDIGGYVNGSIISLDFNEDGNLDVAMTKSSDHVTVIYGLGDGTFIAPLDYDVGQSPRRVAAGDFNEDGHVDLVSANYYSDNVSVLIGSGSSYFEDAVNYSTGDQPSSVTIGDFNEDGLQDLAVTNRSNNPSISILTGIGYGMFASLGEFPYPHIYPSCAAAEDLDGDGHLDLAVCSSHDYLNVMRGYGDGTFWVGPNYYAGRGPYSVTTGDFTGNGYPDIAVGNSYHGFISILINLTDPSVSTVLSSWAFSLADEGIEISWALSERDPGTEFAVYRESDEEAGFTPLGIAVEQTGSLSFRVLDNTCVPGSAYRYRVDIKDQGGASTLFATENISAAAPRLALSQNYPNPFNPSTTIKYSLPSRAHVSLDIFDASGRRIKRLVDKVRDEGRHEANWSGINENGERVTSGVYFYRLKIGKSCKTRRMILMR